MIANIYQELYPLSETGGDMLSRIKALAVYEVFEPLVDLHLDAEVFNKVLFYVLECYSKESPVVQLDISWQDIKERVFSKWEIPKEMLADVVLLRNPAIRQVARNYVDYQESDTFRHYCMLQDLYVQLLNLAVDFSLDPKAKYECAVNADQLRKHIKEYKEQLAVDFGMFQQLKSELPKAKIKKFINIQVEDVLAGGVDEEEEEGVEAETEGEG